MPSCSKSVEKYNFRAISFPSLKKTATASFISLLNALELTTAE